MKTDLESMSIRPFADRVGVKYGTLKRWIHEGMDGVVRDAVGNASAIRVVEGEAWCAKKKAGRSWSFSRRTVVYFCQCARTQEIKIGYTQDLTFRMSELHRKDRRVVRVLATLPGDKTTEEALHRAFSEHRVGDTEWFTPADDLVTFIARVAKGMRPADEAPKRPAHRPKISGASAGT